MEQGGRRRKRRRGGTLYAAVITAMIIIAVLFGIGVFFKVSQIEVVGASMYDDMQVVEASGIEIGDSIFFIRESAAGLGITNNLPYIDEVRIVRSLPGTVTIEVTESYPIASFSSDGSWWIIDKNAKILEQTTAEGASDTIDIRGLQPIMPAVGEILALGDEGRVQLLYLRDILSAILTNGFQDGITWIDMTNISNIKFDYYSYEVNIGSGEALEDKFWLFSRLIDSQGTDLGGRIDLSNENEARYIPE